MKILSRCTSKMALTMRMVAAHSTFFKDHPEIDKLLALEWIRPDEIWQYSLTDEGCRRLCKWKTNIKRNYRSIALYNAIYTDGLGYWACYIAPPEHKRKGDRINIDGRIIKEMIKNGELVFNKTDGYWYAGHKESPVNRTHRISACDLPF